MADKLDVFENANYGYQIAWFLAEEGDMGATLGDQIYTEADLASSSGEDWDTMMATLVASQTAGVTRHGHTGFVWETRKNAMAALRAIKLAMKDKSSKPWPDWAIQASAAGWSPPKGWTP